MEASSTILRDLVKKLFVASAKEYRLECPFNEATPIKTAVAYILTEDGKAYISEEGRFSPQIYSDILNYATRGLQEFGISNEWIQILTEGIRKQERKKEEKGNVKKNPFIA